MLATSVPDGAPFSCAEAIASAESGITFAAGSLAVDELGRPASCSPGCTVLGANTTFSVSGGGKTWTVQVSPLTGFATVN